MNPAVILEKIEEKCQEQLQSEQLQNKLKNFTGKIHYYLLEILTMRIYIVLLRYCAKKSISPIN